MKKPVVKQNEVIEVEFVLLAKHVLMVEAGRPEHFFSFFSCNAFATCCTRSLGAIWKA